MKTSRLISLAIILLSVAAILYSVLSMVQGGPGGPGQQASGAGPGGPDAPGRQSPGPAGAGEQQYAVEIATVERTTLEATTKLNGEVIPRVSVEALPEVAGTVREISVDVGDRVAKGSVIGYVDPSRPGTRFQASPVSAPVSGTVTAVYVDPGTTVSANTPLLRIGTLDALEIVVDIPERYVGAVAKDTPATVVFSAYPDEPRRARVARISPVLDPASRSKEVAFELVDTGKEIQAGMFAEATIVTDRRSGALTVPVESVVTRGGADSVFVVENGEARLQPVELGISAGGATEIISGLSPGARVVVRGQNLLEDGSAVRVVGSEEEAS